MHAPLNVMLGALLVAGPAPAPPLPPATSIPDEPGVVVLPDYQPTLQAVAADVDGDGIREVVRLVPRADEVLVAEIWREAAGDWARVGRPVVTIAGEGGQAERAFIGRPVRLLVRAVDGADRVTLVRQPDFSDSQREAGCCLLLDDLRVMDGQPRLVPVAEPGPIADAIHVLDFEGDGTDELLATRSLPPLGDVSYPTEARVFRWSGSRFADPTATELPIGSGDTPFVLGDSDGRPGEEAAIISATGRPDLHRLTLDQRDSVRAEAAGLVAVDALGVPLDDGRGIAVIGPVVGLAVMPWPRDEAPGEAIAEAPMADGRLVGVVELGGQEHLVAHRPDPGTLHVLRVSDLAPLGGGPLRGTPSAAALDDGALRPYIGPLPGGGLDARPASIAAGHLFADGARTEVATLAGGEPVGLVGHGRQWLAIRHAPTSAAPLDPSGGRLLRPAFSPNSSISLVPVELATTPEANGGGFAPARLSATPFGDGELAVPADGAVITIEAPPGSRVYLARPDSSDPGPARTVDESGTLNVIVTPRAGASSAEDGSPVSLIVATPGGHAYISSWVLRVLAAPPDLQAMTETPFGSSEVTLRGRTAAYAEVTVDGLPVEVEADGSFSSRVALPPWPTAIRIVARDPIGNVASLVVTGVGVFDYRRLPWIPITLLVVAAAGVSLYLRVPRPRARVRPASDDAGLEELDPDEPA